MNRFRSKHTLTIINYQYNNCKLTFHKKKLSLRCYQLGSVEFLRSHNIKRIQSINQHLTPQNLCRVVVCQINCFPVTYLNFLCPFDQRSDQLEYWLFRRARPLPNTRLTEVNFDRSTLTSSSSSTSTTSSSSIPELLSDSGGILISVCLCNPSIPTLAVRRFKTNSKEFGSSLGSRGGRSSTHSCSTKFISSSGLESNLFWKPVDREPSKVAAEFFVAADCKSWS